MVTGAALGAGIVLLVALDRKAFCLFVSARRFCELVGTVSAVARGADTVVGIEVGPVMDGNAAAEDGLPAFLELNDPGWSAVLVAVAVITVLAARSLIAR